MEHRESRPSSNGEQSRQWLVSALLSSLCSLGTLVKYMCLFLESSCLASLTKKKKLKLKKKIIKLFIITSGI